MSLSNVILLSQIAGYAIALILSLCITVPMSLHQDEFRGHCLLFSTGEWREDDGQFLVKWASQIYCNYVIFVGVVLFLAAAVQLYRMAMFLHKGTDSSFVSAFVDVIGNIWLSVASLIAALMVTLGFLTWCEDMTERFPSSWLLQVPKVCAFGYPRWARGLGRFKTNGALCYRCEVAAGKQIDEKDGIDTTHFYIEMGTAQFGTWASFAIWVGLSVCALLKLCRYHQLQNLRASMYRERQKLINGGGPTSSTSTTNVPTNGEVNVEADEKGPQDTE
ncbi:Uncharacterized protein GBIM_16342 [Gryllus bimaculatus]|nr:Uncharacterized protein GBIM_16342 [Gryllus bimaculatus]